MSSSQQSSPLATGIWRTLRRPRVVLALLGGWAVLAVVTEFFTSSGLFMDLREWQIEGALAGRAMSWQGVPLAALYLHSIRDPAHYRRAFWIGLIEQGAVIAAGMYHLGTGDISGESVILPVVISAGLGVLVLFHLYEPRERQTVSRGEAIS
jgi:hypothetical protein